jgi:hypothetical protein
MRKSPAPDHLVRSRPADLSTDRWTFHHGDVRIATNLRPSTIDYLFIDAGHTVHPLVCGQSAGSLHDAYHRSRAGRFSERRVVLDCSHGTAGVPRDLGLKRSLGSATSYTRRPERHDVLAPPADDHAGVSGSVTRNAAGWSGICTMAPSDGWSLWV